MDEQALIPAAKLVHPELVDGGGKQYGRGKDEERRLEKAMQPQAFGKTGVERGQRHRGKKNEGVFRNLDRLQPRQAEMRAAITQALRCQERSYGGNS